MIDLLNELWETLPVKESRYPTGQWLTATENDSPIIRRVLKGKVEVVTKLQAGEQAISQAGQGQFLGIRNAILPDDALNLKWQVQEETVIEEISWSEMQSRLDTVPGIKMFLQQEARERLYQLLVAINPLFKSLPRSSRKKLMEFATVRLLHNGEKLIKAEGDEVNLYMLIFGRLIVDNGDLNSTIHVAGDVIGEIAVLGFLQLPVEVLASQGVSEVIEFPAQSILDAARSQQDIRDWLVSLCQRRMEESIHEKLDS